MDSFLHHGHLIILTLSVYFCLFQSIYTFIECLVVNDYSKQDPIDHTVSWLQIAVVILGLLITFISLIEIRFAGSNTSTITKNLPNFRLRGFFFIFAIIYIHSHFSNTGHEFYKHYRQFLNFTLYPTGCKRSIFFPKSHLQYRDKGATISSQFCLCINYRSLLTINCWYSLQLSYSNQHGGTSFGMPKHHGHVCHQPTRTDKSKQHECFKRLCC